MVGLLPLLASLVLEDALVQKLSGFKKRLSELLQSRPDLANQVFYSHNIDSKSLTTLVNSYRQNIINNTDIITGAFKLCINKGNPFRSLSLMEASAII